MASIRLLSTDFDGTIVGFGSNGRCSEALAEALLDHRLSGGLWAINTGRSLLHAIQGVEQLGSPVQPDFLLTNEREIFCHGKDGEWEPYGSWNALCSERHSFLFDQASGILSEIRNSIGSRPGVKLIFEDGLPAGLVAPDEETMDELAVDIRQLASGLSDFSFQRNSIYMRFCHAHYDKGSALAELCRLEGVPVSQVFAAGDHHNDLPMLRQDRAGFLACPANAIPEVKSAVRSAGGCVASLENGEGVAEALCSAKKMALPEERHCVVTEE